MNPKYYKVCWYEYHDPSNWEGVKSMRKSLRIGRIINPCIKLYMTTRPDRRENDGWYECYFEAKYYAKDAKDAYLFAEEQGLYDESCSVFSGFEKIKGKWVRSFTEEGVDERAKI